MTITRRQLLKGLILAPVAPAIVRAASIMPVQPIEPWRTMVVPLAPDSGATWASEGGLLVPPEFSQLIVKYLVSDSPAALHRRIEVALDAVVDYPDAPVVYGRRL